MKKKRNRKTPSHTEGIRTAGVGAAEGLRGGPMGRMSLRNALLVMLGLVAINLFIYLQVRNFEFTGWDDPLYVTQNTQVSNGLSLQGVRWALTTGHAANWHPLTWLSLMLDVQVFGVTPGPIHLVNVLFHIVNSLLLFWILYRMTLAPGPSAFVAGLFAAHPLHVESVAWVAERKDVLSTCLLLMTVWGYWLYVRRPALKRYLPVLLLFAFALMAKPMVITLPVLLLLLDFWPLRRASLKRGQGRIWLRLTREKLPLMAMAMIVGAVTLAVQREGGTMAGSEIYPLGARVSNACVSYVFYLIQMLWPANLSAFYPFTPQPAWAVACSILALAGISFTAIRMAERHPYMIVGWSWYLISLVPVIGWIQVGNQSRADRYTYVPLMGIFIAIAWGAAAALRPARAFKAALTIAACAVICALAIPARLQAGYWRNPLLLWRRALDTTTGNAHANVNYGFALMDAGDVSGAIAHYGEALRIAPAFAEAHNALGVALLAQNEVAEAHRHFAQALRIDPDFADAQGNTGIALMRQGKNAEAIPYFRRALESKPDDAKLHQNFGLALAQTGQPGEAMTHFARALQIKPDFADARVQMGNLLLMRGDVDDAISCYKEAIRLQPDSADAHTNLGIGLLDQGLYLEAATECREALRLNPELPEAHLCLGNVFAQTGREDEGIDQYRQALRIKPAYAEAHNNLAMVLINRMRDDEALVHLAEAVRLKPEYVDALNNLAIALMNTGRVKEAIPHLQKVLILQPDNRQAKETLEIARSRRSR